MHAAALRVTQSGGTPGWVLRDGDTAGGHGGGAPCEGVARDFTGPNAWGQRACGASERRHCREELGEGAPLAVLLTMEPNSS